jgi:hypothetical protein
MRKICVITRNAISPPVMLLEDVIMVLTWSNVNVMVLTWSHGQDVEQKNK